MRRRPVMALVAALASCAVTAPAQVVPERDAIVEAQLLPRTVKTSVQRLATADAVALGVSDALTAARRMLESGRASGDPRTLGYAESLLARWTTDDPRTPLDVLVLRATIEQSRHRFDVAVVLLDRVLARDPAHGQALLTRATIAQVQGNHRAARDDCERLRPFSPEVASICRAQTDALTGSNDRALAALRAAAERTQGDVRSWALASLAQVHEQRGDPRAAAAAYRAALAASDDLGTRLALADVLIAQRSWDDARIVLADAAPADGTLLRRWKVERATGIASPLGTQLQARFDEAAARGELLHAREAAVFALERGDAPAGLRLARDNWRVQREPADLLVLARAAHATRDAATLGEVDSWVRATGLADARVRAVLHERSS